MTGTGRIADMDLHERPRERLAQHGARAMADAELVAVQLGSGRKGESALALAHALLAEWGGVAGLSKAEVDELARHEGVGPAKAARLVSAFALGCRVSGPSEGRQLSSSADIAELAITHIGRARTEQVLLIVTDNQCRVQRTTVVAKGGIGGCVVPAREILSLVLRHDGVAFALAHNHPSGRLDPSAEDVAVTERLRSAAAQVGLRFLDHVIVASDGWRSVTAVR